MLSFLNSLLRSVRNYFWIFIFSKIVPNPTKKELESKNFTKRSIRQDRKKIIEEIEEKQGWIGTVSSKVSSAGKKLITINSLILMEILTILLMRSKNSIISSLVSFLSSNNLYLQYNPNLARND